MISTVLICFLIRWLKVFRPEAWMRWAFCSRRALFLIFLCRAGLLFVIFVFCVRLLSGLLHPIFLVVLFCLFYFFLFIFSTVSLFFLFCLVYLAGTVCYLGRAFFYVSCIFFSVFVYLAETVKLHTHCLKKMHVNFLCYQPYLYD